jgi:replicative DNA helicase
VQSVKYPAQYEETVLSPQEDAIIEMELAVLSASVWNKRDLALVMEQLTEEDFSLPTTRGTFRVIKEMFVAGEEVDKLTLKGRIAITSWFALTPPTTFNLPAYIKRLHEDTQVRQLRELGVRLQESHGDSARLATILDEGMSKLVRRDGYRGIDLLDAIRTIRADRASGAIATTAIDYPWARVNRLTRGLRAGWLCYLAGRPREGKTAAAIELAVSAAKAGKKVLFNSLEMDTNEIAVRVAQRYGLDNEAFYMGNMGDHDWKALDQAVAHGPLKNIRLEFAPTMAKLTALVRSQRPDLVIVDYVQLMEHGHNERVEGTTQTSHSLKRLAIRYRVPIVALSQLNRPGKDQRNPIPDLSDLRDSGALEQDGDQVIFIWREQDKSNNIPTPKGMFIVNKARMGQPGKQVFNFDGVKQMFLVVDERG